jgi:hypothetical protein
VLIAHPFGAGQALLACSALAWMSLVNAQDAAAPPRAIGAALEHAIDPATEDRVLALSPERISDREVQDALARVPAPRILCFQGSPAFVTMAPFAEFLIEMGYPEERLRDPRDGSYTHSSHLDSGQVAGMLAWYYERDGMMPMLIGHSSGGLLVIRVLYALAGTSGRAIPVWNPVSDSSEGRTSVHDPLSGAERTVVGLKVPYAAAIATGKLPRLLRGQWGDLRRLRKIPDSVDEFTGFQIAWDPIAGTLPGADPYRALGSAFVRNVSLPASTSHIGLPRTRHLALNPATRAWINDYAPDAAPTAPPRGAGIDSTNIEHAADIWHSVKKHWCLEAQRLIRARRERAQPGG